MGDSTVTRIYRECFYNGTEFDMDRYLTLDGLVSVVRGTDGRPIVWYVEPDQRSADHFHVTFLARPL